MMQPGRGTHLAEDIVPPARERARPAGPGVPLMKRTYPVDLQTHSNFSDGTDTPEELVAKAAEAGIRVLAVTDHDSVRGAAAAQAAGNKAGVHILPAIELSTAKEEELDFLDINILGYGIDPADPPLLAMLEQVIESRIQQKICQVGRLHDYGLQVPLDEVLDLAGDGVPGRLHIAQIAIKHNPGTFSSIGDVFRQYLAPDAVNPTYVPRPFSLKVREAIELIHKAGGKAVLAHPGVYNRVGNIEEAVRRMVEAGLDGLEVFYPYRSEARGGATDELIPRFAELAERFGLFATGGSDYHGQNKEIRLGEAGLKWDQWHQLKEENGW